MKLKSLLLASVLCLGGSTFLSARTRIFTTTRPTMIGHYNVPPGTYQVRMNRGVAEITDLNHFMNKRPVKISAKELTYNRRFDNTVVCAVGPKHRVTEIGFSNTRDFAYFK